MIVFPSKSHESVFRRVLEQTSDCSIERADEQIIQSFRPKHLFAFEQKLHNSGLRNCETTNAVIKILAQNPTAAIRIVHPV